jgi:hypothetical protein
VSILQDIWDFVGPAGKPVAIAGITFSAFQAVESLVSDDLKKAASEFIGAFDVRSAAFLPVGTQNLFQHVFGRKHISFTCVVRSILFSIIALSTVGLYAYLFHLKELMDSITWINNYRVGIGNGYNRHFLLSLTFWVLIIDYISLYKTRLILNYIKKCKYWFFIIFIILTDAVVGVCIFGIGASVAKAIAGLPIAITFQDWLSITLHAMFTRFANYLSSDLQHILVFNYIVQYGVFKSIAFFASFLPSIWLWIYVISLALTRVILRSERLLFWLRWALPLGTKPFRSVGAVAAIFVFVLTSISMGIAAVF